MKFYINKALLNQVSNFISRDNNLACSGELNNAVQHIKNRSVFRLNRLLAQKKKAKGKRNAEVAQFLAHSTVSLLLHLPKLS